MTNLKYLRLQKDMSQEQLSKMIGVHSTQLSRMECGWFARPPANSEESLKHIFGKQWTWEKLMESPPDLEINR